RRRQFDLCLFCSFFQTLQSHRILSKIGTFVFLEFFNQPINDYLVEIITTQVSVTVCIKYFEHTATELKDRNIKCTSTKVEYGNLLIFVSLVKTIGQRSSRRFVYDTFYFQSGNLTS